MSLGKKFPFTNLVFEGGGVRGIAYGGALKSLDEYNILPQITRVAGTSAGAITAALVALDFSATETASILNSCKFTSFADRDIGIIRNLYRLLSQYGVHRGDAVKLWMRSVLIEKGIDPEISFADLSHDSRYKDLRITGTNLSRGKLIVFSAATTPGTSILDAVRISMSIPVYFVPVRLQNDLYIDGGILSNYPIRIFDDVVETPMISCMTGSTFDGSTLGFKVDSSAEIDGNVGYASCNFLQYLMSVVDLLQTAVQTGQSNHADDLRTVKINSGDVSSTEFDLSDEKMKFLVDRGYSATNRYLDWFIINTKCGMRCRRGSDLDVILESQITNPPRP